MMRERAITQRARVMADAQLPPNSPASMQARTTAEARANAYIPDDVGIPKPYGGLAPFKPTAPGSSMRHIRKPVVKDIVI